jgi:formate dehydrogenase subunit delta
VHLETLVAMANQIGDFYEALPDRAEALKSTATHIRRSWDPRMRREFLAYIDQLKAAGPGRGDVNPLVMEAVEAHRVMLEPKASPHPA